MRFQAFFSWLVIAAISASTNVRAEGQQTESGTGELLMRLASSAHGNDRAMPAVIWLEPLPGTPLTPFVPRERYSLMQKNRTFIPHLQVVPVGAVVQFPNDDPFFHNVFSLFDGKRFDLGLYETGSTKSVKFPRAGVSYIFCNIHPEMSAVVLALSTPLYAIADSKNYFDLRGVPPGDYRLHVWIEGVQPSALEGLSRTVHLSTHLLDLGTVNAPIAKPIGATHTNKFGKPYETNPESPY
jgi:hypothetical protein